MTSASDSSSPAGLTLDPSDPDDARIMRRQQRVARQSGRNGADRAAVTRGRADLEAAYDQGAADTAKTPTASGRKTGSRKTSPAPAPAPAPTTGAGPGAGERFRTMGPGWSALKPTSPTRPPHRLADAGGFLVGLSLYMVAITYIRYGPEGWLGWLSAKFLNKPLAGGSSGDKPRTSKGGAAVV